MPFEMERIEDASGAVILALNGTLTMGSQLQRLEWGVEELIEKSQKSVVLDMAQVGYLDSSAIGVLIGCNGALKKAGGEMRLAALTERVKKILEMTGVDSVLLIDADRNASLAAFGKDSGGA